MGNLINLRSQEAPRLVVDNGSTYFAAVAAFREHRTFYGPSLRGYTMPRERSVDIDEWRSGVASGEIREVFACGTAAVITPVGRLVWEGGEVGNPEAGATTLALRKALIDIQYGRAADTHGWMRKLV